MAAQKKGSLPHGPAAWPTQLDAVSHKSVCRHCAGGPLRRPRECCSTVQAVRGGTASPTLALGTGGSSSSRPALDVECSQVACEPSTEAVLPNPPRQPLARAPHAPAAALRSIGSVCRGGDQRVIKALSVPGMPFGDSQLHLKLLPLPPYALCRVLGQQPRAVLVVLPLSRHDASRAFVRP